MQISIASIKQVFAKFLRRYHVILFVVVVVGGLSGAIFLLNNVLILSDQSNDYTSQINKTTFDADTIKKLKMLKTSGEQTSKLDLSGGRRINPFIE